MLFVKSYLLGFSVSAPVGPIGLLCIHRTLALGRSAGFLTGFGAVAANVIYASIAAFGFSVISALLLNQEEWLKIIGSFFLLYIGIKTFLKKLPENAAHLKGDSRWSMFGSTFLLMITNPITILNFVAMFTGLGFDKTSGTTFTAIELISGVFLGATSWWFILAVGISVFRKKITPYLGWVNKLAGATIILLGVFAVW
ncbi:LysE family translocator [Falsibacillus albus]|uniref:LysE family translocator n=1 Tax=Falsibacillus albus TaxID=2478915 RepID=A0A3L7JUF9_9BACI|nr:LysE family transporter [Falsibacillus albus]RLQ94376.1 LysE family translocator [Falsibacillus albus]